MGKPAIMGAYTELFAGLDPSIKPDTKWGMYSVRANSLILLTKLVQFAPSEPQKNLDPT